MNLCMVNDEKLTVDMMKTDISWNEYGIHEVYVAYDVAHAKSIIETKNVDILLCDIEMPGENGIALLRWVRDNHMDIECIFLTCHASFSYAQEAISLGCQEYILIPAAYEDIAKAVNKVAKRIHKRKEELQYQKLGQKVIKDKVAENTEQHGEKRSPHQLVKEIEKYIEEHLGDEDMTVNSIAYNIYIHPVYMNRVFKKEKGVSVGTYISTERMRVAALMLQEGKLSGYVIAEQLGYKSYSNFNLNFKKTYGCTPTQYLKERTEA